MAVSDASRFDYLFEPIDGNPEVAAVVDVEETPVRSGDTHVRRYQLVLMAVGVLGAGLGLLLLWPRHADAVQTPAVVTTTVAPRATVTTSSPADTPPSQTAPPAVPTPEPSPETPPTPLPAPVVESPPSTSSTPEPRTTPGPTPIIRAPMSVSPVPRPAFPNQRPGDGSDDRGLLGLGGLL